MRKDLVIAGWFASPGIRELIGLAFSVKEHPVWWGMKKEFEELDVALLRIHAFVEKIEKLQMIHYCTPEREAWLWQLKDAVDEANDVLDKLAYYKLKEDVKSGEEKLKKRSGVEDGPWFPCLKNLKIEDCSGLVALPPLPHSLERLDTYDVGLTTLPRLWQCRNNDCKSSSWSKLRLLKIRSCPKLTSLAGGLLQHTDHFVDVKELFIEQCKKLVHLPVEGFQKLISLRSLEICMCPRLQQRCNAPHDDFFLPSSIQNISLMDRGKMDASLPGAM